MEILRKTKKITFFSLLFIIAIACKNRAQSNEEFNNGEILKSLPDELANKTWIPYYKGNTYEDLLRRVEYPVTRYVKTSKTSFSKLEGKMEFELVELPSKKIVKSENKYIMYLDAPYIDYINLKLIDGNKGILDIEYVYQTPLPIDIKDSIFTISYVDKSYITPDNFPEPKKEKIVLEKEKSEGNEYEKIEKLPILGKFACVNIPTSFLSFKYEEVKLRDSEGEVIEIQPYKAILSLTNQIYISCTLRKIRGSENRYALFFRHTENTDYHPEDILSYSSTHPIAEIEILENNTIKNKWIGMYNRRTKKIEGYGVYNWIDKCDNMLGKIED